MHVVRNHGARPSEPDAMRLHQVIKNGKAISKESKSKIKEWKKPIKMESVPPDLDDKNLSYQHPEQWYSEDEHTSNQALSGTLGDPEPPVLKQLSLDFVIIMIVTHYSMLNTYLCHQSIPYDQHK